MLAFRPGVSGKGGESMVEEREVTPILKVEGLTKVFDQKAGKIHTYPCIP